MCVLYESKASGLEIRHGGRHVAKKCWQYLELEVKKELKFKCTKNEENRENTN